MLEIKDQNGNHPKKSSSKDPVMIQSNGDYQNNQEQLKALELQMRETLNLIDPSNVVGQSAQKSVSSQFIDQLQSSIKSIYQDDKRDNKQKIAAMSDVFNNEIITKYREICKNLVEYTSD